MMVSLKFIKLFNFKSFRGETIIGPIHPFTAIVGPNGCGKSNIIDAVRFVLGEKSSALRVKRLDELAYGATFGRSTVEETYVEMTITTEDSEERTFTRVIRGESSQYKMDDRIVTCDFYMAELKKLNLDIKLGSFLVPQNYIESIVMKTSKELTALFEQISGSDAYKTDYDRLKLDLQKIEEKIQFAHQMKKQLLMQKKCAAEEKAEAMRYLELQEQYIKEKSKFQLLRLLLIKKMVKTLQDSEREIKLQIDKYRLERTDTMELVIEKKSQCKQLSDLLQDVELSILEVENITQEKRVEHAFSEETVMYWQKKHDHARASLDNANKARRANEKVIQELEDELEKIRIELTKLKASKESGEDVELSNSQIKRYMDLKIKAENQAKDIVMEINDLTRNQQLDRDKLDNHNRRKQELEDKVNQITLTKNDHEKRFEKLRDLNAKSKAMITKMTTEREKLNKKLAETKINSSHLENAVITISEELCELDTNNDRVSHQRKKTMIINTLKQRFPGVHGRLSDLCKPIHSRYNVAVITVFKRHIDSIVIDTANEARQCIQFLKQQCLDVETFLPLDSIKTVPLKRHLRLPNVKLLFDVLDVSTVEVSKAVLFVTENTLVCETAEDARRMAYKIGNKYYNCVSLDGCFYRKSGLISGGKADLIVKAKQWEDQQISRLRERKVQLVQELRNLPSLSRIQSELNEIDIEIKGNTSKCKYMEQDMKDTEKDIARACQEIDAFNNELAKLGLIISEIQRSMQERDEKIKDMKRHVSVIEDDIFASFCKDINIPNINYYEKTDLWTYQTQQKKQLELEELYNRIENQWAFEKERDTKSKIVKWQHAIQQSVTKLNDTRMQESLTRIAIEQEEVELSNLRAKRADIKQKLGNAERDLVQCKSRLDNIGHSCADTQKAHILLQGKVEQKKTECNIIFTECKIEDITIPVLSDEPRNFPNVSESDSTSVETNRKISSTWEMLTEIDFSHLPDNVHNNTEDNLQHIIEELRENLKKIQSELEVVKKPNFKAQEKTKSIAQQIQEANAKLEELRSESNNKKIQFETVKVKRCKLFLDCFENVTAEIDSVYKSLVNDSSAQAFIMLENPEEPYAGAINYSCIAPQKRFQPMEYLSGGEKALASLALLFALQRFKSTPFFIMDEADAAIDKTSVKHLVRFIQSQPNAMQFIVITFQMPLQSSADALIGITIDPNAEYPESNMFAISLSKYKESI